MGQNRLAPTAKLLGRAGFNCSICRGVLNIQDKCYRMHLASNSNGQYKFLYNNPAFFYACWVVVGRTHNASVSALKNCCMYYSSRMMLIIEFSIFFGMGILMPNQRQEGIAQAQRSACIEKPHAGGDARVKQIDPTDID